MSATSATHDFDDFDDVEVEPSPFRVAIGRARIEASTGAGPAFEPHEPGDVAAEPPVFEYRLVRRRGKRSAEEGAWNDLGRKHWELVGVTGKHAAFKRRVTAAHGSVSR